MFKILLVDDHRAFRKEFMRLPYIKATSEFDVAFEANDGKEALQIVRDNNVDIIISDIRMPVMSGIELLETLNKEGRKPIFIILSEYGTFEYAQKAIDLGAFGYLTKPVENHDVEATLNKVRNILGGASIPTITTENIDNLVLKILSNSTSSTDYILSLLSDIEETTKYHEILMFLDHLFSAIGKRTFEYIPWMSPFINSDIFSVTDNEEIKSNCKKYISDKITFIQKEINKFGFNVSPLAQTESIQGICIFILNNILNPYLNSSLVAEEFFFNKSYLSQLFKEKMSTTMIKFITKAKMEYAVVRLSNPSTRISELSSQLNFENPDYFSSIFKKTYGISPAVYQKEKSKLTQD